MNNNQESNQVVNVLDFEHLLDSLYKCKKNVSWKESVANFYIHGIEQVLKLEEQLANGTYQPRPTKTVHITHPKERIAVSIAFRDRVYQRSLNDNLVYPLMTRSFIYDNCACQKGKGTDFARGRLKCHLQRCYRKNGLDAWVLQCDIKHYYDNMRHDTTNALFREKLPVEYADRVCRILNEQYLGDTGYNPGSQVVQIAGISVLDKLDHKIKERMHIKYYIRYMDDFILIHHDRNYLIKCMHEIQEELAKIGLELHPKKTKLYRVGKGIPFLGFKFRLTETGKVVMSILGDNVKNEKRKLRKMVKLVVKGRRTKEKIDQCYSCWVAHAEHGNSYKLIQRMNKFYDDLWRQNYDFSEGDYESSRGEDGRISQCSDQQSTVFD